MSGVAVTEDSKTSSFSTVSPSIFQLVSRKTDYFYVGSQEVVCSPVGVVGVVGGSSSYPMSAMSKVDGGGVGFAEVEGAGSAWVGGTALI